ncbi:hypothetical protein LMQ12_13565, partial [Staphylococcus aureus]|uniref:hypothetical protein n=1 Tax=Staphylococcus aureus TaxID=1280 RepID=UPI001E4D4C64
YIGDLGYNNADYLEYRYKAAFILAIYRSNWHFDILLHASTMNYRLSIYPQPEVTKECKNVKFAP